MRRIVTVVVGIACCALACVPENAPETPRFLRAPDAGTAPAAPGDVAADPAALAKDPKQLLAKVDQLKAELASKPRDFQVNVALGSLFYDNGRYLEAIEYLTDAAKQGDEAEQRLRELRSSGALEKPGDVPAECRQDTPDDASKKSGMNTRALEATVAAARALDAAKSPTAVGCWSALVVPLATLHAKRGNAWYLIGNAEKARDDHDRALAIDPHHPEALFFLGALTLELARGDEAQLARGRELWQRLLDQHPDHPRAALVKETLPRISELFGRRPPEDPMAGHPTVAGTAPETAAPGPAPLPAGMAEAMAAAPRNAETDAALDRILAKGDQLLAEQKWQEALDTFKQVMPLRPDGRVALGMGTALARLGKPTAERVLMQAIRMPNGKPNVATLELAKLVAKRDPREAKGLLAGIAADTEVGADARALLNQLP